MDIIGPKSLLSGQETEVRFRDAAQLYTQGESLDALLLYIAIAGLKHAGVSCLIKLVYISFVRHIN